MTTINKQELLRKYNNEEIKDLIEKIEEDNNIRISYLNRRMYEQGFMDGVNLMIECLYK